MPLEPAEPLRRALEHFVARVADRGSPRTGAGNGRDVVGLLEAGRRSLAAGGAAVRLDEQAPDATWQAHPTAIVEDGASIGAGTRIWHHAHVMPGARVGADVVIGQDGYVGGAAVIGDGVRIQNNVSVYDRVTLEDHVFVGPSVVFTNVVNPRSQVQRKDAYAETVVREGASLGANSTIVCPVQVGRYAFVGAGAVVTRDVPDHALVVGNPARPIGWMCTCGERLDDDLSCSGCDRRFARSDGQGLVEAP